MILRRYGGTGHAVYSVMAGGGSTAQAMAVLRQIVGTRVNLPTLSRWVDLGLVVPSVRKSRTNGMNHEWSPSDIVGAGVAFIAAAAEDANPRRNGPQGRLQDPVTPLHPSERDAYIQSGPSFELTWYELLRCLPILGPDGICLVKLLQLFAVSNWAPPAEWSWC